jgi:transcriptional regulator with XRE-family HTH domain
VPATTSSTIASTLVGEALRATRVDRGISQAELARRLGVAASYVAKVGAGRANLTVGQLMSFANAMEVGLEVSFPAVRAEFKDLPPPQPTSPS